MKTIKFYTLGCKVNQYETQSIREGFLRAGFQESSNGNPEDICLINTCTVTHKADRDSRHAILKARGLFPQARIIVTGCLAEKDTSSLAKLKSVNYIISKKFFPEGISVFSGHTRAFLKIQDGCDNFCSYCKVPLVRGRSRSRGLSEIICEAKALVRNGFKEIVLCGICLGSYGKDLNPRLSLVDVIESLEKIKNSAGTCIFPSKAATIEFLKK
jgi:threonylcarbamoyladenosine tRNA methylthiotransferase MtaB